MIRGVQVRCRLIAEADAATFCSNAVRLIFQEKLGSAILLTAVLFFATADERGSMSVMLHAVDDQIKLLGQPFGVLCPGGFGDLGSERLSFLMASIKLLMIQFAQQMKATLSLPRLKLHPMVWGR